MASKFADEVIIAVNKSNDNTLDAIKSIQLQNLKIIECDVSYEDPLLDGKLKNIALQNCSGDILIQLDLDEYIPLWQKPIWYAYAEHLLNDSVSCYMIASINLYGDWKSYRNITPKWYMHKRGLHRGPPTYARKPDGTIDTSKSDTCELIDCNGNLVFSRQTSINIKDLESNNTPFVVHFGYLDFDSRLERNKKFWHQHWRTESGGDAPLHKVHMDIDEFTEEIFKHNLKI